ncbi:MAG TPA: bifunctional nuclease domain-containing protein [Streptosporangiaceae bacterium]
MRDAVGGTKEPLADLVTRHWDTAVFLAARVLGSVELGRDAAQEAAVAAMTNLDRLRSPERFGAWFCGIALNVARRWLRQVRVESLGLGEERASESPGPAEMAEIAEIAARVRGAIAALPDGQRNAVLLFYLQGLSHREVAAELAISIGAVKSRLHQARVSLAPRLATIIDTPAGGAMTTTSDLEWIDASVAEVRRGEGEDVLRRKHIMVLRESGGERRLPIWIGPVEATALALALESVESPRPFTYKLATGLLDAAGSRLSEVRITRLMDSVYYAAVIVAGPNGVQEVDARPSDAVNLALVANAPIRVDRRLFSNTSATDSGKFLTYPVATAELAAEAQQRMREMMQEPGKPQP